MNYHHQYDNMIYKHLTYRPPRELQSCHLVNWWGGRWCSKALGCEAGRQPEGSAFQRRRHTRTARLRTCPRPLCSPSGSSGLTRTARRTWMPPCGGTSHYCPPESTGSVAPGPSWAQCAAATGQCGLPGPVANRRHRCLNTHRCKNSITNAGFGQAKCSKDCTMQ